MIYQHGNTVDAVRPGDVEEGQPIPMIDYKCYVDETKESAAALFVAAFGKEPERIFIHQRLIWAGPVPVQK